MAAINATRALALVGTPFRQQGRNSAFGLDCVGLCLSAYDLPSRHVRQDYRLRGVHFDDVQPAILAWFRKVNPAGSRPGDLLLMRPAPDQLHLAVLTQLGFVHADVRLRRVVEVPGQPAWPIAGIYRLRRRKSR